MKSHSNLVIQVSLNRWILSIGILLGIIGQNVSYAQQATREDSIRIFENIDQARETFFTESEATQILLKSISAEADSLNVSEAYTISITLRAIYLRNLGKFDEALELIEEAKEKVRGKRGVEEYKKLLIAETSIAIYASNYQQAFLLTQELIEIAEATSDFQRLLTGYNYLANIYERVGRHEDAIEAYTAYRNLAIESGEKKAEYLGLMGIATIEKELGELYCAKEKYEQILNANPDDIGRQGYQIIAEVQLELGGILIDLERYKEADSLLHASHHTIMTAMIDHDEPYVLYEMGRLEIKMKHYSKAKEFLQKGVSAAMKANNPEAEQKLYLGLYELNKDLRHWQDALMYLENYYEIKNEIGAEQLKNELEIAELQLSHEHEKERDSLAKSNELTSLNNELALNTLKADSEKKSRENIILLVSGIVVVMALLVFFSFRSSRRAKQSQITIERKNNEILRKSSELEIKNTEVTDSINSAVRIQNGILPRKKDLEDKFIDVEVIFHPKDIVSGDFYWMKDLGWATAIAVADCTGHGVPGALMTAVCSGALGMAMSESADLSAGSILSRTDEMVSDLLPGERRISEGMDISLCLFFRYERKIEFAGANRPLCILKRSGELDVIKGNRCGITGDETINKFDTHRIQIDSGDRLFMFSDGLPDQFGGPRNKKIGSKRIREMLADNSFKTTKEHVLHIEKTLSEWKTGYEQTDDISLIGIGF